MATTAVERVFVDTNILVFANTATAPLYLLAQARLQALVTAGDELWVSRQVLREYLATLSRHQPFSAPVAAISLAGDVTRFHSEFQVAEDGPAVTVNLLALIVSMPIGGKQIHDANIGATMQAHGLRRLLTHNTTDFARFGSLITVEPLVTMP